MAEKKQRSAVELEAAYRELLKRCAAFDPETKSLMRQREQAQKQWMEDRKAKRQALVDSKGLAYQAWQAAKAAEESEKAQQPEA